MCCSFRYSKETRAGFPPLPPPPLPPRSDIFALVCRRVDYVCGLRGAALVAGCEAISPRVRPTTDNERLVPHRLDSLLLPIADLLAVAVLLALEHNNQVVGAEGVDLDLAELAR